MRDLIPILDPPDLLEQYLNDPVTVQKKFPIGFEQLRILHSLFIQVNSQNEARARAIITDWLAKTVGDRIPTDHIYHEFRRAIRATKDFLAEIIHEFVPDALFFPMTSDGVVRPTVDPLTILKIMWEPPGDRRYAALRRFEAEVLWHLGLRFLIMRLQTSEAGRQLRDLTLWFERELFLDSSKVTESYRETVDIIYDPKNDNRFVSLNSESPESKSRNHIRLLLWYRFIQCGDRLIRVLYDSRVKREEDIFRKTILHSTSELPVAKDTCGITLIFRNDEELELGYRVLTDTVFTNNAGYSNLRVRGNGGKRKNIYSSGLFEPARHFSVFVRGGLVEVQIYTIENFFNRKFSLGPENHHLYRLEQIKPLLKLLFPDPLYLNWDDPELQKLLTAYQMEKIKTNFLGFSLS